MQSRTDDMPGKPVLNISYHVIPMDGDRVQFRKAHDVFVIKMPGLLELVRDLFPLLDGRPLEDVIDQLQKKHSRESILGLLQRLAQRHVVKEAVEERDDLSSMSSVQKLYYSQFTPQPGARLACLGNALIAILGLGPLGVSVATSLGRSGVGALHVSDPLPVTGDDVLLSGFSSADMGTSREEAFLDKARAALPGSQWEALPGLAFERGKYDYIVVCLEKYQPDILERINTLSMESGTPYTWCCLDCHCGTVGPTVLPHETACFRCYTTRTRANADYPAELQAFEDQLREQGNPTEFGYMPSHIQILAGLASLEVVKDLSGLTPPLTYNAQLEINLLNMEFALHPVLKLPRCSVCGRLLSSGAPVRPFKERTP